jgi:hypothetical protein
VVVVSWSVRLRCDIDAEWRVWSESVQSRPDSRERQAETAVAVGILQVGSRETFTKGQTKNAEE